MNKYFSVGSDPELVLLKNGIPHASVGLIHGSKDFPRPTKNGWVLEDNVLAEFNIKPAKTAKQFAKQHLLVMKDLEKITKPLGLELSVQATALYSEDQLITRQAKEAGCQPDYDAWELKTNDRPQFIGGLRSCGGHVHICFPDANEYGLKRVDMVKVCDLMLGVPSVVLDSNQERRKLYGKAGAHRPKYLEEGHPYDGVEYRVLSNFWLASPKLMEWVFNQVKESIDRFYELIGLINGDSNLQKAIVYCINFSNTEIAEELINTYKIALPPK